MFDRNIMWQDVKAASRIGIAGHIRPDGDCIGACLAFYNYIKENYDCEVTVHMDGVPDNLRILSGADGINTVFPYMKEGYDVFFALDCGDEERLGKSSRYLKEAKKTYCIDHHGTNPGFADENLVVADASATCEILYDLMDKSVISTATAECLYLGIVHDTGVFKHSNTTRHTMEAAGALLDYGISPEAIIDRTMCEKTYLQNQILGRCLMESILCMDGRVIISYVNRKVQALYGLTAGDTDGVIDQMRITKGVDVAILLKEMNPGVWRVSMRSNEAVDVAEICGKFGGGGHKRASGCTMNGQVHDVINNLTREIGLQL